MKMKTIYKNYKNLFELLKINGNSDIIIGKISEREINKHCLIYLSRSVNISNNLISIIMQFDKDDKLPNIQFILSEDNMNLKIRVSSFGEYDYSYDYFVECLARYKEEVLRILEEINVELAFKS